MKRLFYLILIIGFAVSSCNKSVDLPASEQEVSFKATSADMELKASTTTSICDVNIPNEAEITIILENGSTRVINVGIFTLGNEIFTETFKLPVGTHSIERFDLIENIPSPTLVYTVPFNGSTYAGLVSNSLPFDLVVDEFIKKELSIQVLCFNPDNYEDYGFSWFALNTTTVNDGFCFFGDICLPGEENIPYSAWSSPYYGQLEPGDISLPYDIPAIFEIRVYPDGNPNSVMSYSNADWLGTGAPLCVHYPLDLTAGTKVYFELWVNVIQPTEILSFDYELYHTWYATDNITLYNSEDNAVAIDVSDVDYRGFLDFVIGSCVSNADLTLPPHDNPPDPPTYEEIWYCFLGDVCLDPTMSVPANFQIELIHNGSSEIFSSVEDGKLCVQIINNFIQTDEYSFNLYVEVETSPGVLEFVLFKTLTTIDDGGVYDGGTLLTGIDNDIDFVLGDCHPADIIIDYTPPVQECGDCDGKVSALTLLYEGAQINPLIVVKDKNSKVLFNGTINNSVPFSFTMLLDVAGNTTVLTNEIEIYVNGSLNTEIHTSCSDDIFVNDIFGDFKVIAGESSEGGPFCIGEPTPDPAPFTGEETAFGYDAEYATCFLDDPYSPANSRWGWTNGLYTESETIHTLELWAGAADCDQSKGYYVGTVTFTYNNETVNAEYNIISGVELKAVHLYAGITAYPMKGDKTTVAPGKFTFVDDKSPIATSITISDFEPGDKIYIIAHADVYGN